MFGLVPSCYLANLRRFSEAFSPKSALVLAMCLSVPSVAAAQAIPSAIHANPRNSAMIVKGYGKLPLAFEANQGQTDPRVNFLSRGAGYSLFLTPDEVVLSLREGSRQDAAGTSKIGALYTWRTVIKPLFLWHGRIKNTSRNDHPLPTLHQLP